MHRSLQILSALGLALLCSTATAQDVPQERPIKIGMFGAGAYNIHEGAFATYDGVLQCGLFEKATTLEWQAGNVIDFPIGESFGLSTRLYYHKANGDFTSPNETSPFVSLPDGSLARMQSEQVLVSALDYVMLEALGRWDFIPNIYVAAGPAVGLATRAAYEQEERIISPNGLVFTNGGTTRTIVAGNFEEQGSGEARRNLRLAASAVLGADIQISDRFYLNPEVGFTLPFTNVLNTFDWKVSVVRAGIGLKYGLGLQPPPPPLADVPPPPVATRPAPVVALDVAGRKSDGTTLNSAEIIVAEERATDVMPLLPYVFFPAGSNEIPARYRRLGTTAGFSEKSLNDSVLGVYHHVLNIIGERMKRYPEATITITGCRELTDEKGGEVSAARATAVKEYLVSTWGIAPSRIGTTQRGLPSVVSNREIEDGREENRRAEIASNDPRILAPVEISQGTSSIEPAELVLTPRVQHGESITKWNLRIIDDKANTVWETGGTGAPTSEAVRVTTTGNQIRERAVATQDGNNWTAQMHIDFGQPLADWVERDIPVRHIVRYRRINGEIVNDSLLERYGLMFFDFNTPNISDFNAETIKLIQSRMRTNSAVRITGLTDRTGEADYNLALSRQRADATAQKIKARILPESIGTTGAGEMLIYNNDLPEGRFYNRTVMIEIATPL